MLIGCLGTETLFDFLEGRTDPGTRGRIEQHTSRCKECREVLSSLARSGTPPTVRPVPGPDIDRKLAPGTQVGRYVIAHELGAGGMGVVYAAHDPALDRMVAVKVLRGDSHRSTQERLQREARAMAQLAHPNVVAVYDVGAFDDRVFVAMEYVPGDTLARWSAAPRSHRDILEAYCAAGKGLSAAHAAGIVHRDFKPENVLIGKDGRVRVSDFGLARTTSAVDSLQGTALEPDAAAVPMSPDGSTIPATLTVPGTLLGTPYYLAPELYDGAEANAHSDQFSFCVALFTTLFGERPFDGYTFASLRAHVRTGRLRDPQASLRVPRRVRAAIKRGLAVDPAARFASLGELLAELGPTLHRRARWAGGVGAALLVGLLLIVGLGAYPPPEVPDQRCTGAAAAFATAWNAERRGAIGAAFTATRAPYAATVLRQVISAFDQYAVKWTQAHTEACRATRIFGQQTEADLELRMTCLERRRQEVAALVDTLATGNTAVVARSATAAVGLPDVAACADLAVLRQIVTLPANADALAKLGELIRRLDDARAKLAVGSYLPALELTRAIVPEAHTLGYLPFEAEAEFQQGLIERMLGDTAHAEASLMTAIWSAEAGRNDMIAARTWTALVFVIGVEKAEYARALTLAPRATAAIARLGGNADIEASLERALGAIAFELRDLDAAVAHLERAIVLEKRVFGPEHINIVSALCDLGLAVLVQGHADRAVLLVQQALEIEERSLGSDHPGVAYSLNELGEAYAALGNYVSAEQEERRALTILERSPDADHPALAQNLIDLARAVRRQGRNEEALVLARRAVAVGEEALGLEHPDLADQLVELGLALGRLGHYAEADKQLQRAEAIATKAFGADHVRVMHAVIARGDVLMLESHWRDAATLYEHAIPILEKSQGTADELASALASLCRIYVELHEPARAVAPLEQLASKLGEQPPDVRVSVEFTLARALWNTGGDRARARELANQAFTGIQGIADANRDDVAQMERWLASHRVP